MYYPISVLPNWMQTLAIFSPVTYLLDGLRKAIQQGVGSAHALARRLAVVYLRRRAACRFGLWVFNLAERYAKRTGRLKRNG